MSRRPSIRLTAALLACGLLAAVPVLGQQSTVRIQVDASGSSTRLVLTHSAELAYEIRPENGSVEIVYATPVRADPAEQLLNDPILTRYRMRDDRHLVLSTGPGYRAFESFELHNPFRLIVDLQGSRSGGDDTVFELPARPDRYKKVVVIDPGHGGIENGAVGPGGLKEKAVTLDLARRLRRILQNDSGLHVVLTRDEDRLVGLEERSAIANHNRADLFLSIHLNASQRSRAQGAETYFLSTGATDDEARTLAALENRSAGVPKQSLLTVDGEQRDLDLVLWDLAQNQYLAESSVLAERVQRHLNELTGTRDRGVRQAPFRVLMAATMPAILVEAGFISNPDEEAKFRTTNYREQVADAMARAVREFLSDLDRLTGPTRSATPLAGSP